MIDFMVIGLPRSGTAWLSNLLTTDTSICLHEAFLDHTIDDLDAMDMFGKFGIAETSAFKYVKEINSHNAKKIIVERDLTNINLSLFNLDLPIMLEPCLDLLNSIDGYRIQYHELFVYEKMAKAYEFLIDKKLSYDRHKMLCNLNVQNHIAISRVQGMFHE